MTIPRNLSFLAQGASSTGVLSVAYGGTGLTSLTAGYIPYGNGASEFSSSANLTFDGASLSVGGTPYSSASFSSRYTTPTGGNAKTILGATDGTNAYGLFHTGPSYSYAGVNGNELWYYSTGYFALTFGSDTGIPVKYIYSGSERMRIQSGVSIGNTTDPGAGNLSVNGVIKIGSNQAVNGPAFSAYPSSNSTTFAAGVFTKVILDSTEYNINSNFSSSRFTPTIAGYYQINGQINFSSGSNVTYACIYKNGSRYRDGAWMYSVSTQSLGNVSAVIYFNGTTDYVELYGANGNATSLTNINSGVPQGTVFSGVMVRGA